MIVRRLRAPSGGQRGFTVLEMAVAVFLTGIIGLGASIASAQVLNQTSRNADFTAAGRQAMNAIFWISRDARMAQEIEGAEIFPEAGNLVFNWTTWENEEGSVTYSLSGGQLRRSFSTDGGEPVVTVVAEYISADPQLTGCAWAGGVLTVKITSSLGEGSRIASVTRSHETVPRPGL